MSRSGVGVVADIGFSSGVCGRLLLSSTEELPVDKFRIPAADEDDEPPPLPPPKIKPAAALPTPMPPAAAAAAASKASVGASANKALAALGDNRVSVTLVRFFLGATTKDMGSVCSKSPPGRQLLSPNIIAAAAAAAAVAEDDEADEGDEGPLFRPLLPLPLLPPGNRGCCGKLLRSRTAWCCDCD